MINIVLVEPQIPHNTGAIGRLALALNARLHLIHPLGFRLNDAAIKRCGMDYFLEVDLREWDNLAHFWAANPLDSRHFFLSTRAQKCYFEADLSGEIFLYFGREDAGLDAALLESHPEKLLKIPMQNNARSLNLATCVSAVAYEAWRQNNAANPKK